MRTIGDTIKLLREERRISQQALADGLNIKRNTISMWESDCALCTKKVLFQTGKCTYAKYGRVE